MKQRMIQALFVVAVLVLVWVAVLGDRAGVRWQLWVWCLVLGGIVAALVYLAELPLDKKHRTNKFVLKVDQPRRFGIPALPFVGRGQNLEVQVEWGDNPNGWRSIFIDNFRDLAGRPIPTRPARLEIAHGEQPNEAITIGDRKWRRYVECNVSYVDRDGNTWTINGPAAGEIKCDWPSKPYL